MGVDPIEQRLRLGLADRLKLRGMPIWVHAVGLGGAVVVLLIAVAVYAAFKDVAVWDGWRPAEELRDPQYAERIYPNSVFRTRMNTWSNLCYILFGFYAIAIALFDWGRRWGLERGYLAHAPIHGLVFGFTLIYLGLGSGFFHASLTRCGQQCDVGAMYSTLVCMAGIAIGSWLPYLEAPPSRRPVPSYPVVATTVLLCSAYLTYYKWEYSFGAISFYLGGLLLLFAGVSCVQPGKYLQLRWLIAALGSIVLGAKVRELDIQSRFAGPDSIFQGHALWHLLSCWMYVFVFLYFRSEERVKRQQVTPEGDCGQPDSCHNT